MIEKVKTVGAFVALFICVFLLVGVSAVSAFSGSGSGTSADPWIITTPAEWKEMDTFPILSNTVKHYALGNDIDFQTSESLSQPVFYMDGSLDGRGHSLKNFYNITSSPIAAYSPSSDRTFGMIMQTIAGSQGIVDPSRIENLVLENCVMKVTTPTGYYHINTPTATDWHTNIALLMGNGDIKMINIFVDQNCKLLVYGYIDPTHSSTRIGIVRSGADGGSVAMENVVSRGEIDILTPLRKIEDPRGDFVGGLYGYPGCYGMVNVLSAGTVNYTLGYMAIPPYTDSPTPLTPNGGDGYSTYCYASGGIYYDSTTLNGLTVTNRSKGVATANIKTQASFPYMTFGTTGFRISNLTSRFEGYPIPYYFDDSDNVGTPPTPTPTPTGTPIPTVTVTGTPTPTSTATPVPTTLAPSQPSQSTGSIKWMKSNQTTATTTAYLGEPLKIVFDTLNTGQNGNSLTMDYFLLRIYKKDVQMNTFQFSEYLGYYGMPYGASAYLYKPWVNAWSPYNDLRIVGYNDYNYIPGELHYPTNATSLRVELVGMNVTEYYGGAGVVHILSSSTISLTKSPFLVQNFTDWIKSIGGEGLAYVVAMLIILILACIPFLIFRRIVMILEIMMITIGLGLAFMLGLISLWIVFGVGVGLVAIFILTRNSGVQ